MSYKFCKSINRLLNDIIAMIQSHIRSNPTLEELHDIVAPIAAKHGIIRVYLFGSRARGESNEESDYDFCITVPERFGLMDMGGFLYDLKEILEANVDLVCEEDIYKKPNFMEEILRDRKIIFEA